MPTSSNTSNITTSTVSTPTSNPIDTTILERNLPPVLLCFVGLLMLTIIVLYKLFSNKKKTETRTRTSCECSLNHRIFLDDNGLPIPMRCEQYVDMSKYRLSRVIEEEEVAEEETMEENNQAIQASTDSIPSTISDVVIIHTNGAHKTLE